MHTRRNIASRSSNASINRTTQAGDTVMVLLIKTVGATNRAGGPPTFGGIPFTQANSTQKAAASPEASAELWYLLNPPIGTFLCNVPNTGAATLFITTEAGQAQAGMTSALDGASGGNNTSTNPTPGAIVTTANGDIGWAIV